MKARATRPVSDNGNEIGEAVPDADEKEDENVAECRGQGPGQVGIAAPPYGFAEPSHGL